MTVQPARDQLRLYATHVARSQKGVAPGIAVEVAEAVPQLLDQLDQAEARIKAVRDLCDDADKHHASVLIVTKVRRALDG